MLTILVRQRHLSGAGIVLTLLMEFFKTSGPNDSVEVRWENDAVIVNFRCECSEGVQIADFDVKVGAD